MLAVLLALLGTLGGARAAFDLHVVHAPVVARAWADAGVSLAQDGGRVVVAASADPAVATPGDSLLLVDGLPVDGLTAAEATAWLEQPRAGPVSFTLARVAEFSVSAAEPDPLARPDDVVVAERGSWRRLRRAAYREYAVEAASWGEAGVTLDVSPAGVLTVFESSNAAAGVGDALVAVNGEPVAGLTVQAVADRLGAARPVAATLATLAAPQPRAVVAGSWAEMGLTMDLSEAGALVVASSRNRAVRAGAELLAVDGAPVDGRSVADVVAALRAAGPLLELALAPPPQPATYTVEAPRWAAAGVTLDGALAVFESANADVRVGDRLVALNGQSVAGLPLQAVADLLSAARPVAAEFEGSPMPPRGEQYDAEARGLELEATAEGLLVVAATRNGGVRAGDAVLAVDGESVAGRAVADVLAALQRPGSVATLRTPDGTYTAAWDPAAEFAVRGDGRVVARTGAGAVRAGDSLVAVDGRPVEGLPAAEVLALLDSAREVTLFAEEFLGVPYEFELPAEGGGWPAAGVALGVSAAGRLVVHSVEPGSAAALAMVELGDEVTRVDGASLDGRTVDEVAELLRAARRVGLVHNAARRVTVDDGEARQRGVLERARELPPAAAVEELWRAILAASDTGSVDALLSALTSRWTGATTAEQAAVGAALEALLGEAIAGGGAQEARAHHVVGELARRVAPAEKLHYAVERLGKAVSLVSDDDPLKTFILASYAVCRGQKLVADGDYAQADRELWPLVSGQSELGQVMAAAYPWATSALQAGRAREVADFFKRNPQFADKGWNALMATAFDAAGEYRLAAAQFAAANEAAWDELQARRTEELLRDLAARVRVPPAIRRSSVPGSRRLVFIVGLPRSGSSLLEAMLAQHSAGVLARGEVQDLQDVLPLLPDVDAAARAGLARYPPGPARVTNKLLGNVAEVEAIASLFPEATVLNVVRDSRDTALSIYQQQFYKIPSMGYASSPEAIRRVVRATRRLEAHWAALAAEGALAPLRYGVVRYEELVADPEPALRAALALVGLEWEDGMLDFHRSRRNTETASVHQVRRPLNRKAVGKWERYVEHMPWLAEVEP